MNWAGLLALIAGALLVFVAIRMIRNNPQAFSKDNLSKSITTIGFLTLLVIVVCAFCVWMLR